MANLSSETASSRIHDRLKHPVIDGDGHWLESYSVYLDYLRDIGGKSMADDYMKSRVAYSADWYDMTPDERLAKGTPRASWWHFSTNALDRATVGLPALLHKRLDDFGIDFAIVYPTLGLSFGVSEQATDLRRAMCRAYNNMAADMFAEYSDRMTPVAVIPMLTPEEAIDEAEYVVNELHFKAAMILGTVMRPLPAYSDAATKRTAGDGNLPVSGAPTYIDNLVLDSVRDYDPLWQKFMELKLAVTTHSGAKGWEDRRSTTNFCFNHVGHFAEANHTFARALFFSGVTYRYPELNFAFLEGGVGWARNLVNDIVGHWHSRSPQALRKMRPSNLDADRLRELFEEFGGKWFEGRAAEQVGYFDMHYPGMDLTTNTNKDLDINDGEIIDDFGAAHIHSEDDIRQRFKNCYFGCEADDPMTGVAFDPRFPNRMNAILGSDIAHFDVTDLTMVLREAYELVEDGFLGEEEFKAFTFGNIAELHGKMNPEFFKGTVVEDAVAAHLGASGT